MLSGVRSWQAPGLRESWTPTPFSSSKHLVLNESCPTSYGGRNRKHHWCRGHESTGRRAQQSHARRLASCGLRVTELIDLQLSKVDLIDGLVRVIGKGNKERVVPIGQQACDSIDDYLSHYRANIIPLKGHEDTLFWDGKAEMTRQMAFTMLKRSVVAAGIRKRQPTHLPSQLCDTFD